MKKEKELKMMEKELKKLNAEFDAVKMEHKPLTSRIVQLEDAIKEIKTDIEQEAYRKVKGGIKPGCWVEVETDGDKFIGYFHSYDERDGYETPVFITPYKTEYLEYMDITHIKKVSQKVAMDYIKRG